MMCLSFDTEINDIWHGTGNDEPCFLPALLKLLTRLAEWLYLAWTLRQPVAALLSKIDERGTVKKTQVVAQIIANEMKTTKVFCPSMMSYYMIV